MSAPIRWLRRFPGSGNNFDLVLADPQKLDAAGMIELLDGIEKETWRKLTLSSRASKEFRRWFSQPDTPLMSEAYVLLSNWFLTNSGDRNTILATRCEALWDALFPCRPVNRLSSAAPGRNHVMLPSEFESFWPRLLAAQGEGEHEATGGSTVSDVKVRSGRDGVPDGSTASDQLRATIHKEGLECAVEGSPRAVADFLRLVSNWEAPLKPGGKE